MSQPESEPTRPFRFYTQLHLRELTGVKAKDLQELLEGIQTLPGSVIYHHTHHFLQQHQYLSPEPPNDFAYWVTEVLNDDNLGERLASINTCEFSILRELRERIIQIITTYLQNFRGPLREVAAGEEFYFIKTKSFVFPTRYEVSNLEEFSAVLEKITIQSIYFHMFDARLRLEKGANDFSLWLASSLGEKALAQKIAGLDPYTFTMEGLRKQMIRLIHKHIP